MRPCAFSTRFHAPVLGNRSLTVLVTIPLSQRKRSPPRTSTRRIQPRSWIAAPEASAAVSASGASNSLWGQRAAVDGKFVGSMGGFKHGGQRGGLQVCGKIGLRHGELFRGSAPDFSSKLGAKPHPDYSLEVRRAGIPAAVTWNWAPKPAGRMDE